MRKSDIESNLIKLFISWSAISSVLVLILIKFGFHNTIVYALKDGPLYIVFALIFPFLIRDKRTVFILSSCFVFCLLLIINFLAINSDYSAPLYNVRQIIAPIFLLAFFCSFKLNESSIDGVERFIKSVTLFVFAFGVIDILFHFWKRVDLTLFFSLKGIPVDEYGLSYMFYEPIINYRERMTSTFLDPISLGHFFSCVLIYFFYFNKRKERLILIISAIGLVLTFSKGAMLQAFIALTAMNFRVHLLYRIFSIAVPFMVFFLIPNKDGILIHINGLLNSISNVSFFGYGIGSSGNYTKMFSSNLDIYYELGISDTFLGLIIGQIGVVGLALWLALSMLVLWPYRRKRNIDFIILGSLLVVSALSENSLNVTSFMGPAIIIALSYNRKIIYE